MVPADEAAITFFSSAVMGRERSRWLFSPSFVAIWLLLFKSDGLSDSYSLNVTLVASLVLAFSHEQQNVNQIALQKMTPHTAA
jgi:hypothetical protein